MTEDKIRREMWGGVDDGAGGGGVDGGGAEKCHYGIAEGVETELEGIDRNLAPLFPAAAPLLSRRGAAVRNGEEKKSFCSFTLFFFVKEKRRRAQSSSAITRISQRDEEGKER